MNYQQTTVSGTSWVRCKSITISNPLAGHEEVRPITGETIGPAAVFTEEKVITLDGADIRTDFGSCAKAFDPATLITLLNPDTGLPTGATVSHGELYVILYSLYIQTAAERDAAILID